VRSIGPSTRTTSRRLSAHRLQRDRSPAADTDKSQRVSEDASGVAAGEYDHLVPLELGGANATSNLWGEVQSIPNPKDKVENRSAVMCSPVRRP
jgi:5-methylcytosine-specific restriction endonuclease McrA